MLPTNTISLDFDIADEASLLGPLAKDIQAEYFSRLIKKHLKPIERHVLYQRFFLGKTFKEIAADNVIKNRVNLTRIFHIENNAIRKFQIQIMFDAKEMNREDLYIEIKNSLKKKL